MNEKEYRTKTVRYKKRYKLKKLKIYISYHTRVTFNILLFLLCFSTCLFLATKALHYEKAKIVNYNEQGNINYKVLLKENEFYDQEYLTSGMAYVSSLIDKINIDLNYNFHIDKKIQSEFDYQVLAKLVIASRDDNTNYLTKDYILKESKVKKLTGKDLNIKESVDIDYDYYNNLANNFKSSYAVDTNSYLRVYLRVSKASKDKRLPMNDTKDVSVNIPLSEKTVSISLKAENEDSKKSIIVNPYIKFNLHLFILEIITLILSSVFIVKIIKLLFLLAKRKSVYDIYVSKLLRDYDRLIVETTTGPDFSNNHIIDVKTFAELLDVRDNLKLPIMYFKVVEHIKCYFYIKHDNDVYLVKIKANDLEGRR